MAHVSGEALDLGGDGHVDEPGQHAARCPFLERSGGRRQRRFGAGGDGDECSLVEQRRGDGPADPPATA